MISPPFELGYETDRKKRPVEIALVFVLMGFCPVYQWGGFLGGKRGGGEESAWGLPPRRR
jgi:hypothetical protein